jgi:hypothetical protein
LNSFLIIEKFLNKLFKKPIKQGRKGEDWHDNITLHPWQAEKGGRVEYFHRRRSKKLIVIIPPRIRRGQKIRLREMGAEGKGGREPGDLYLKVRIEKTGIEVWTEYISEKEHFKASFPGRVKREYKGLFSDDGISPGTVMHYTKINKLLYQINVTRIKKVFGSSDDFLKLALGEQLKSIDGAELKSNALTSFKGYAALEYEMEIRSLTTCKGIMVLVKDTLYNLFLSYLPNDEPEFGKFINSFEVVK